MADDDEAESSELSAVEAATQAKEQVVELTGHRAETVSSVRFEDGRWQATVELVELDRIPPSTDVLGTYAVVLDSDGSLMEYERTQRYLRNQSMEEQSL